MDAELDIIAGPNDDDLDNLFNENDAHKLDYSERAPHSNSISPNEITQHVFTKV